MQGILKDWNDVWKYISIDIIQIFNFFPMSIDWNDVLIDNIIPQILYLCIYTWVDATEIKESIELLAN